LSLIIILPFISAIIGWFTNWIAVQMLFHPKKEMNFFFFKWQGIFPANQAEIAAKVGKMVAEELLSAKDIKDVATSPEQMKKLHEMVELKMDDYLFIQFPQRHKIMSAIMPNSKLIELKTELLREVEMVFPDIIDAFLNTVEDKFDVSAIIKERMSILEVDKLEKLMMSLLEKEFRFVELIGGVVGFMIGLVQMLFTIYVIQ
jgi:uncharacterized membrane protein YheB (UPF0754 family)